MNCYFILDKAGKILDTMIASDTQIAVNYANELKAYCVVFGNRVIYLKLK